MQHTYTQRYIYIIYVFGYMCDVCNIFITFYYKRAPPYELKFVDSGLIHPGLRNLSARLDRCAWQRTHANGEPCAMSASRSSRGFDHDESDDRL